MVVLCHLLMDCEISVSQLVIVYFPVTQSEENGDVIEFKREGLQWWLTGWGGDPRRSWGNPTNRGVVLLWPFSPRLLFLLWTSEKEMSFCCLNALFCMKCQTTLWGWLQSASPFQNKHIKHCNMFIQKFNVFFRNPIYVFPKLNDVFHTLLWLEKFV